MQKLWLSTTLPGPTPYALVDDTDFAWLNAFTWFPCRSADGTRRYALRRGPRPRRRVVMLQRQVMGVQDEPNTVQVIFRNGNGLDCRKGNLVIGSPSHARVLSSRPRNSTSGYRGVQRNADATLTKRWQARILFAGKVHHLGSFDSPEEAARAYDRAALQRYGDVILRGLNFPELLVAEGGASPST